MCGLKDLSVWKTSTCMSERYVYMHDDVIKWKHFPRYEFPTQRPVTRSIDVFFDLRLNKQLSKQSRGWWFETLWKMPRARFALTSTTVWMSHTTWPTIWYLGANDLTRHGTKATTVNKDRFRILHNSDECLVGVFFVFFSEYMCHMCRAEWPNVTPKYDASEGVRNE